MEGLLFMRWPREKKENEEEKCFIDFVNMKIFTVYLFMSSVMLTELFLSKPPFLKTCKWRSDENLKNLIETSSLSRCASNVTTTGRLPLTSGPVSSRLTWRVILSRSLIDWILLLTEESLGGCPCWFGWSKLSLTSAGQVDCWWKLHLFNGQTPEMPFREDRLQSHRKADCFSLSAQTHTLSI